MLRSATGFIVAIVAGLLGPIFTTPALSASPKIGIVVMHGKGGSPSKNVSGLANGLEDKGYLVANIEMPWSGNRNYDVDTNAAAGEISAALADLRSKGAQKLFVAGHSQGGVFALYYASTHAIDGVICIAPGGNVASKVFQEKLGASIARARQLVAEGKADETVRLEDFEGKKGTYPLIAKPAVYLTWFDTEGAMNSQRSAAAMSANMPILWIVAQNDYPDLRKTNIPLFERFPKNPHTRLYEPGADHHQAPSASLDEIVRWTTEIASANP